MSVQRLSGGWAEAPLEEFCMIEQGQSPPGSTYNTARDGLPFFQGKAEFGDLYPSPVKWCSAPTKVAKPEDVLISVRAPVGPTNLARTTCCIGRGLAAIRPLGGISPKYLLYALRNTQGALIQKATGSTFSAVGGEHLRAHRLHVAPLAEQDRIVADIEKHFTRLDAAVVLLKRVQANLKVYRASVLKAAAGGRLVPTEAELARQAGRDYESGEQLLQRILKERLANWQIDTLPSEKAHPIRSLKEPQSSDSVPLPEGWTWTTLNAIASIKGGITKGQRRKATDRFRSVPYLRVANVQRGFLDLTQVKNIEATEAEIRELRLLPGDALFTEGGDRDKLGRGWVWSGEIAECIHQNHIFRARLHRDIEPKFVSWYANTTGQRYFYDEGKHTTNLASINLTKLRRLPLLLPPAEEQRRIVTEVERHLSVLDHLEDELFTQEQHSDSLRQSVLRHAFEGKLVPHDPTDEPASVLLERIRAERAAVESQHITRRARSRIARRPPKKLPLEV